MNNSVSYEAGEYLGIAAAVIQVIGYLAYNRHLQKSEIDSNPSSWAIWAYGSVLNLLTYKDLVQDSYKEILPLFCTICCILTFIHIALRQKWSWPDATDWIILGIDLIITLYWFVTSNSEANVIYQIGTIMSFVPMIRGLIKEENYENPIPWVIWTVAYEVLIAVVYARWDKWEDVVYPAVCFVFHWIIAGIACLHPARKS